MNTVEVCVQAAGTDERLLVLVTSHLGVTLVRGWVGGQSCRGSGKQEVGARMHRSGV